ncbi:MAG: alternative ribosome rescue aminoacyl-tRNA hydrolase ArfB [Gemmatimonadales bacterium]|nr:alternative ribosome rescue aminoacyl-tRNA hydrolase ArfB [Gemmatimonadales bacterium]
MPDGDLPVTAELVLPRAELVLRATRAGGPGGQHVNTSSTRIELVWDVATSPSLTDDQRARLLERLATRLDASGRLRLVAAGSRSQHQNRAEVVERLVALLQAALRPRKVRRATRPTRAAKERRLDAKRRRGEVKRERRRGPSDE